MRRCVLFTLVILLPFAACRYKPALPRTGLTQPIAFPQPAPFERVFVVVLENTDAEDALAQPYLRQLADRGALLRNYSFVARPSQPNYLALTSGSSHGVSTDRNVDLDVRHLGDLLEAKGRSWKSYAEDYPGDCFLKRRSDRGHYVRKHQPFLSYRNVQTDSLRCQRVVAATELDRDVGSHTLADFSLFIPNNKNNGHEPSSVAFAAKWLERTFEGYLQDRDFMDGMLFVVTFDESNALHTKPIYTVLVGDSVQPGITDDFPHNHYSLLRTVEEAFGLGTLGLEDDKAVAIGGIWR